MRSLRRYPPLVAALGALVLQSSFLPAFSVRGVEPDLVLIVCVLTGFFRGPRQGAVVGAATGFLEDVLAGRHLGLMVLARAAAGGLAGLVTRYLQRESSLLPGLACLLATVLQRAVMAAAVGIAGAGALAPLGEGRLWAEAVANGLLGSLLCLPALRAARRRPSLAA